jgi:plastocyanin
MENFMKLLSTLALLLSTHVAFAVQPLEIQMKSLSFDPKVSQALVGQPVVWKNTALTDHTATSTENSPAGVPTFDTGLVHPGKASKTMTFDKPGTYNYQCSIHGKTMSGTINVQANKPNDRY